MPLDGVFTYCVFFPVAFLALLVLLAFVTAKGARPWTWPFIRHIRWFMLSRLVLNTHAAGHIMGLEYRHIHEQTKADVEYLDDVWHGRR